MELFKKQTITEKLQGRTSLALDIFRKTISELTAVNNDADDRIVENADIIKELNAESKALHEMAEANANVINKINQIIA